MSFVGSEGDVEMNYLWTASRLFLRNLSGSEKQQDRHPDSISVQLLLGLHSLRKSSGPQPTPAISQAIPGLFIVLDCWANPLFLVLSNSKHLVSLGPQQCVFKCFYTSISWVS